MVPIMQGAPLAPIWNQLNTMPVPDFISVGNLPGIDPFQFYPEQQTELQHLVVLWAYGQLTDKQFFAQVQSQMHDYAVRFIQASNKAG
jgi:hypothetical protein